LGRQPMAERARERRRRRPRDGPAAGLGRRAGPLIRPAISPVNRDSTPAVLSPRGLSGFGDLSGEDRHATGTAPAGWELDPGPLPGSVRAAGVWLRDGGRAGVPLLTAHGAGTPRVAPTLAGKPTLLGGPRLDSPEGMGAHRRPRVGRGRPR